MVLLSVFFFGSEQESGLCHQPILAVGWPTSSNHRRVNPLIAQHELIISGVADRLEITKDIYGQRMIVQALPSLVPERLEGAVVDHAGARVAGDGGHHLPLLIRRKRYDPTVAVE